MEKDTVLLDLKIYNDLRDFKKKIEEGFTYKIEGGFHRISPYKRFIGTDKALEEMNKKIEDVNKKIEDVNKENEILKKKNEKIEDLKKENEKQISILKGMSWWQFLEWKKT